MALVFSATIVELAHLKRPERTLSHAVRVTVRVGTPLGRRVFTAAWGAIALWFYAHIIKEIADAGPERAG